MLEQNWINIEKTLNDAVSIAFDGCHKIYILMDEEQHKLMKEYEYDPLIRVSHLGVETALNTLHRWYDESCGLRFVSSVCSVDGNANDGYSHLIGQFEDEDE